MSQIENEAIAIIDGRTIQIDRSGVGHCWVDVDADSLPANVAEEIAAEIIDGHIIECYGHTACNGLRYRWS